MGGNIFKGKTDNIKKEYIQSTLFHYLKELSIIFPGTTLFDNIKLLGSAGKKDISGDIDLAIDLDLLIPNTMSINIPNTLNLDIVEVYSNFKKIEKRAKTATSSQILTRAILISAANEINNKSTDIYCDVKKITNGNLFSMFPQYNENNEKLDTYVQIDWMVGNIDWLEFSYYSEQYDGNVKGLHRTQLLLSLFTNKGLIFNHLNGVKDKETNNIVATTPTDAITLLNDLYKFNINYDIIKNYFSLYEYIVSNISTEELKNILKIYLNILDSTRCDIPYNLQDYWLEYRDEYDLSGKFLPKESILYKYL